jgi:peroxiredoxin Q/BCP
MPDLKPGDAAPEFNLPDAAGLRVRLSEELRHGPVVLIFYPMDQTPGCTAQLCTVRDDALLYAGAGVRVFGVNNGNAASHARFSAKHKLNAPLLVDADLIVARAYGAKLGPLPLINRTVVGIARDGTIAFYKRGSPTTAEILAGLGKAAV